MVIPGPKPELGHKWANMREIPRKDNMIELSEIQVRVLGCLVEKESTTPEQYPLTLNALRTACNQKTAREPVKNYTEGEVGRTVRELEGLKCVHEVWGSRAPRYEHRLDKVLSLYRKGMAILCVLMLRGPQTPGELRTNAQRLFEFEDLYDVQYELGRMASGDTPLVVALPRQPGQKEGRYAHLLSGTPDMSVVMTASPARSSTAARQDELAARVDQLESQLAEVLARLEQLENG
jgi:uncharacterized protein YceH (UPF0502 family)